MRIGIYSGSFNPIHTGHTQLANYLIENNIVDEVWFVVSPCSPLKKHAELLDEYLRLEMVLMAIKKYPHFKASDVEFCMPIPSYSIDTLRELAAQYPEHQFMFIIGSDNALVFDQWKDYNLLHAEFPILVYPREGFDFNEVADKYPQMQILNTPYFNISSTEIRASIAQKKDITEWLNPSVAEFIRENDLYAE